MILDEKLKKETSKMVKSRRDVGTPRKRNSLSKSCKITKVVSRPISAATSVTSLSAANIRVVVRVRPPNQREQDNNSRIVVKVVGDQMLIFDPKEDSQGFFFHGVQQKTRDLLKKTNKDLKFVFDKVFPNYSTTEEVFKDSTYSLINSLMNGYNCSVFAYGATGAGKTFTMTGNTESPGITFLTMTELFTKQEELSVERDFELGITYLEVYNELVKDLLNPGPPLNLREDSTYGVTVAGIKVYKINSPDELFKLLEQGNQNRTQHPTDANAESSRSHAVFQVYIQMTIKATQEVRRAKLSMIDLAGSERGSATGFVGARFTEGANINKSLLALGNCINSLADGHRHVPYRDSKLTRLLKDSLGGNCQTVMIANVSPSSLSYEDTYNTLKYAMRAKKIKTNVKRNVVNVEMHVGHYVQMAEQLKRENSTLKKQLEEEKDKNVKANDNYVELMEEHNKLKNKLSEVQLVKTLSINIDPQVMNRIGVLLQEMKDCISKEFQLDYNKTVTSTRRFIKEKYNDIIDSICVSTPEKNEVHKKIGNTVLRFKNQELTYVDELDSNNHVLAKINDELLKIMEERPESRNYIEAERAKLGLLHKKQLVEILEKQIDLLLEEDKEKLDVLERMATILKSCYIQLKGHGFVTEALTRQYTKIIQDFQGKKNVKFHDIPDSGISSTTSITEDESRTNSNKRKIEEPVVELDGTFTMANSATPSKPKSKGTGSDQIISKVIKPPPAKRLANGRISPMNKENKLFRKPFNAATTLAAARAVVATKAGLNGKTKTPTKPKPLADRPRFRR